MHIQGDTQHGHEVQEPRAQSSVESERLAQSQLAFELSVRSDQSGPAGCHDFRGMFKLALGQLAGETVNKKLSCLWFVLDLSQGNGIG